MVSIEFLFFGIAYLFELTAIRIHLQEIKERLEEKKWVILSLQCIRVAICTVVARTSRIWTVDCSINLTVIAPGIGVETSKAGYGNDCSDFM